MTQTMRDASNLTRTLNNSRFVENKHGETSPCRTFKSYNEHAVQIFCVFFLKGSIYGQRIKASVALLRRHHTEDPVLKEGEMRQ